MTVWVDFTFENREVAPITFDTTGISRSHGLKVNGQRPTKAEFYILGSEKLSQVEICKLEEYVFKFAIRVLHPLKQEVFISREVAELSEALTTIMEYFMEKSK